MLVNEFGIAQDGHRRKQCKSCQAVRKQVRRRSIKLVYRIRERLRSLVWSKDGKTLDMLSLNERIQFDETVKLLEMTAELGCCICGNKSPRVWDGSEFDSMQISRKNPLLPHYIRGNTCWSCRFCNLLIMRQDVTDAFKVVRRMVEETNEKAVFDNNEVIYLVKEWCNKHQGETGSMEAWITQLQQAIKEWNMVPVHDHSCFRPSLDSIDSIDHKPEHTQVLPLGFNIAKLRMKDSDFWPLCYARIDDIYHRNGMSLSEVKLCVGFEKMIKKYCK